MPNSFGPRIRRSVVDQPFLYAALPPPLIPFIDLMPPVGGQHLFRCPLQIISPVGGADRMIFAAKRVSAVSALPALRDDPKLVGRDDTKVVGDSVAKAVPFFGNSSPEEAQDCRSELREGFIASVIGDMFVHYAPASFDRIKMRTIGRDEVQPDPASRLPQPLTH